MPSVWAVLSVVLGAFLFSAKGIVIKKAFEYGIHPSHLQFWRQIAALPFFGALAVLLWGQVRPKLAKWDVLQILALGLLGYYFSSWLDFLGLQYVSAGLERMAIYLYPTFVFLLHAVWRGSGFGHWQSLALATAYVGIVLFYWGDTDLVGDRVGLGLSLCLASAFLFAVFLVWSEPLVKRVGSLWFTSATMLAATLGTSTHQLVASGVPEMDLALPLWGWIAVLGVLGTVAPSLLMYWGISQMGSVRASSMAMVGPVSTLILGWWALGETVSVLELCGVTLILTGVALVATRRPAKTS